MVTVGRYFELVVLFWLVPLYVITRGFYTGYVDGFAARSFGKFWGFIWALVLAKIIAHHVSAEVNATPCDRVYSFFSLWLLSFTSIHCCGVYIAKKYALTEKIHLWLEGDEGHAGHAGYAKWKGIDQALGGTVEALVLLALAFFITVNILESFNQNVDAIPHYTPLNFASYALYYPILHFSKVADALNLTGPGAFGVEGYLQQFAAGSSSPLRYCNGEQISHAPYAWTGFIFIAITGPLAFVICLQPVLYSPLWLSELRRARFGAIRLPGSCKVCAGRGIHIRNLLFFGTPCAECHGSGYSAEAPGISPEFRKRYSDRPKLKLVVKSYAIFWITIFILPFIILIISIISGITWR